MNQLAPGPSQSATHLRLLSRLRSLSRLFGFLVLAAGIAVLTGWLMEVQLLKSLIPGLSTMKANTALAFILTGLSIAFSHDRTTSGVPHGGGKKIAQVLGLAVCLFGILTISQDLFGWDLHIDQVLVRDYPGASGTASPGRMSPGTACCFAFLGGSLILLNARGRSAQGISQALALISLVLSLLALIGYAYSAELLYRIAPFSSMAIHTAVSVALASVAALACRPDRAFMATATAPGAGGLTFRRMLPFTLLVPFIFGWIRLQGEIAGYYDLEFGVAIMVVSTVIVLSATLWWTVRSINAVEVDREVAWETLRAAELRYRTTLDSMMEGCQIISRDWRYLYLNDVAIQHAHRAKEELLGRTMLECFPGIDQTPVFAELRSCMESRKSRRLENEFTYPDGTRAWFSLSVEPVPEGIFVLSSDITKEKELADELKRHQEHLEDLVERRTVQLEESNRELEAFSYSVSHDLRAPLRHVSGFTELLVRRAADGIDPETIRTAKVIADSAREMGVLIDNLLVFSRMGRVGMTTSDVDFNSLVNEVVREQQQDATGRDIRWRVGALPVVHGDPSMLRLVLVNLISNAIKYTGKKEHAEIEIGWTSRENDDVIFVRDNGAGFDMKYAGKLFGVFQRLHRTQDFEGTGIGLANVRRIVGRHGGSTWAEGEADRGAAFFFSLPRHAGRADHAIASNHSARGR